MKTVLQDSWEQVRILGGDRIGAEHVLLSILSQDEGQAGTILKSLGVDAQTLREKLNALIRIKT
jgi:ATP-dependent Clp protease ATP-binding subunit ClpA